MAESVDLEVGLHRLDTYAYEVEGRLRLANNPYGVELRLTRSDNAATNAPLRDQMQVDLPQLLTLASDLAAYGKLLGTSLFTPQVRATFAEARTVAATLNAALRVRLFIWPGTPELHPLFWEVLRDPASGDLLTTDQNILFSRFLTSRDRRPVRLRARGDLRALLVIANPSDLDQYQPNGRPLAPINVADELARATAALDGLLLTTLAAPGQATLDQIVERLGDGYDILYLVAHGGLITGEPYLWLEDASGKTSVQTGVTLVTRLRELHQRLALVVLASCQSAAAAATDDGVLAALGPRLAEDGIPAVLAMQGNITMRSVSAFMPAFFRTLCQTGQLDLAAATARGAIRNEPDFWMPTLFMRLQGGRIWYEPGFAATAGDEGFDKWESVLDNILYDSCTPLIGSGLLESAIGSTRELAQAWAEYYGYPMSPEDTGDLPQVAQYLAVKEQPIKPERELLNHVRSSLLNRFAAHLPADLDRTSTAQVAAAVGRYLRTSDALEPHRVLAGLPFRIYISTNPDNTLAEALTEAGKQPVVEFCRWGNSIRWPRSIYDKEPGYAPTVLRPLVYHLFGHLSIPASLVIKEDDYFDYLVGVTSNRDLIPEDVRAALSSSALLFLGFRLDDWDFRALFRSLIAGQEGRRLLDRYVHVAAQLDPEDGRNADPQGARRYLQDYFRAEHISIYWGRVDDFVRDLAARWDVYQRLRQAAG